MSVVREVGAGASRGVALIDLAAQHAIAGEAIRHALERVLQSQQFVLGGEVEDFERAVTEYCHVKHAIGCASGTDALLLALMALDIGPEHEVITTPYSFFATVSTIRRVGARAVLVDIDPRTFNLDVKAVEAAITPRTRALLPVHLFGQCAEMETLWRLAVVYELAIIEDAAQAFGATYRGRQAGNLGTMAALSFFPTKNLGAMGDGGMVTTSDVRLASRLRRLRVHGMEPRYYHHEVGINSRLDALQAAILGAKLPYLEAWTAARQLNAQRYNDWFRQAGLAPWLQCPVAAVDGRHVWNQYVIRVPAEDRDALRGHLTAAGIGCEVYYPLPLHLQPCFADLGYRAGSFPEAERAARESLALPIHPGLNAVQQRRVVDCVVAYHRNAVAHRPKNLRGPAFARRAHARSDARRK